MNCHFPAIQNTLLTVINEKLFRNGDKEISLPLKLLIAASNELPTQGEGLEALWNRFIIRIECSNIKQERNFFAMLTDNNSVKYGRQSLHTKDATQNMVFDTCQSKDLRSAIITISFFLC